MKSVLDPELRKAVMAAVRSQRRSVDITCEMCGTKVEGVPAKRKYCSHACAQRAYYCRRRSKRAAE